jgi:hypothetical protein
MPIFLATPPFDVQLLSLASYIFGPDTETA